MMTTVWAAASVWLLAGGAAPEPLVPDQTVSQGPEKRQHNRIGWLRRIHRYNMGNGTTIEHAAYIDPKTRMPIDKYWADVVMRYGGPGGMNWSPWYWVRVYATDLKGKPADVIYAQRLHAAHFLPGPDRTVAEFAWEVPRADAKGQPTKELDYLCLRLVSKRGDRRLWVDLWMSGEKKARPVRIQFECYPSSTKGQGWQSRVRWAATPVGEFKLAGGKRAIDPAKEWAVFFLNRQAETVANCHFVYLPEPIASGAVSGTYGVTTALTAAAGARRFRFVFDQQRGQPSEREMKRFLKQAPAWRDELGRFDWSLGTAAMGRYRKQRKFLDELLAGKKTRHKYGQQVTRLYADFERLVQPTEAEARTVEQRLVGWRAVKLLDELDKLKHAMVPYHIEHDMLGD